MSLEEAAQQLLRVKSGDVEEFSRAHDAALWAAVTASRDELLSFGEKLFCDPHMTLPIPLQVVVFRLIGLEFPNDKRSAELALSGIEMYCDPIQEENASESIRRRMCETA